MKIDIPYKPWTLQNDYRLEALKLSRDIAGGNEPAAVTLDRAKQFYDFLTAQVGK